MDKLSLNEQELIDAALYPLQKFGISADVIPSPVQQKDHGVDAQLSLTWQGGEAGYQVEIKRGLRPSMIWIVISQMRLLGRDGLLVADYVSPPLAEELREQDIQFIDAAGNAFLRQPSLLVWVKGEKPSQRSTSQPVRRVFQASGLRVLFALLSVPGLIRQPYRVIAEQAGVAHGSVGWVMAELPKLGYLAEIGGKRRLLQAKRLMRLWVEAYAMTLRPKLLLRTYRDNSIDWWQNFDYLGHGLTLGGEGAAARFTGILNPERVTIYGSKDTKLIRLLQRHLQQDSQGNVELLQKFWHFEQEPAELAPPLLIYADLLATGDARCLEAAEALEGKVLDRLEG